MGLFGYIGGQIDNWTQAYVTSVSAGVSQQLAPIAAAAFSLWLTVFGIKVVTGEIHAPVPNMVKRLLTIGIIYSLALGVGSYQQVIVPAVHGLADGLSASMSAGATGGVPAGKASVFAQIDAADKATSRVVLELLTDTSKRGITSIGFILKDLIAAVVLSLGQSFLLVVLSLEVMLARLALVLLLALGPAFILCAAYEPTAQYFSNWVSALVSYCLLQVLVIAILAVSLTIFQTQLSHSFYGGASIAGLSPGAIDALPVSLDGNANALLDALALAVTAIVLGVLGVGVPAMASQLAGGAVVSGFAAFLGRAAGLGLARGMGRAVAATGAAGGALVAGGVRAAAAATPGLGRLVGASGAGAARGGASLRSYFQRSAPAARGGRPALPALGMSARPLALSAPGASRPAPVYEASPDGYLRPVYPSAGSSAVPPATETTPGRRNAGPAEGAGPRPARTQKQRARAQATLVARLIKERKAK